jgi:hypothetical protein
MKIQSVVSSLIVTGSLVGIIAPVALVNAAVDVPSEKASVVADNGIVEVVAENTLQELLDASTLTQAEKDRLESQILQDAARYLPKSTIVGPKSTRGIGLMSATAGRYFKSYTDLSHAQVVKVANSGNKVNTLITILGAVTGSKYSPFVGAASIIYGSYYNYFQTAAANGWGIRITLTIDSYVPTSMGMSWSISYRK